MAIRTDPEIYAIVLRCDLKVGAKLKTLAEESGTSVSALVGGLVSKIVGDRDLTAAEQAWYDEHLAAMTERLKRYDEKCARGFYKHRPVGRPKKRGPKKGRKQTVKGNAK